MNHIWLNGRGGFTCSAFFELLVLPKLIRIAQLQVLPFPLFDGHLSDNLCILGCLQICMGFNNAIAAMCLHIKAIHGQQIQQSSSNERRLLCFSVEVQWWGGLLKLVGGCATKMRSSSQDQRCVTNGASKPVITCINIIHLSLRLIILTCPSCQFDENSEP